MTQCELSGDQTLGSTLFQEAKNTDFIGLNLSAMYNLDIKKLYPKSILFKLRCRNTGTH